MGAAIGDYDNDGDVDVLLLTAEPTESAYYWEDQLSGGKAPNTFAVGAVIELSVEDTRQSRMVAVNSNFTSHNSTDQIFGFGPNASGGIRVIWPDGSETIRPDVNAGDVLEITQP